MGEENQKQTFYAGIQELGLYVKNTFKTLSNPKTEVTMRTYPVTSITKLICEGANFLLMRLLAIYSFVGKFEMSTLYINGDLCRNIYVRLITSTTFKNENEEEFVVAGLRGA